MNFKVHRSNNTNATMEDDLSKNDGTSITFLKDRLYFKISNTPLSSNSNVHYFTIDDTLIYTNFYNDFGPLNLAQLIRFCSILKRKLDDPALATKKIVLYSKSSYNKIANALYLMTAFMMLVFDQTPEEAFRPAAALSPIIVPFRDAGYGANTYQTTILDCLKGMRKALDLGLLNLEEFDIEEYEYYERVEHGDMNWLVRDKFLAFATPHDDPYNITANPNSYPKTSPHPNKKIIPHGVPWRFNDLINLFKTNKVSTVIRLNNKVYDRQRFIEQGIEHIELYFPDGSVPPQDILEKFLEIVESPNRGPIAIHCKAGLGRTGSLIAAYLMKHYKFTASEIIGFLRVMRPGSVVGPQQNWLASMQSRLWAMGDMSRSVLRDTHLTRLNSIVSNEMQNYVAAPATSNIRDENYFVSRSAVVVNNSPLNQIKQSNRVETAVPEAKITQVGNEVLSVPIQPRKQADPSLNPLMAAVDAIMIDSNPQLSGKASSSHSSSENTTFSVGTNTNKSSSRYNLRPRNSVSARRLSLTSRSNSSSTHHVNEQLTKSITTPRSLSGSSIRELMANAKISPSNVYKSDNLRHMKTEEQASYAY